MIFLMKCGHVVSCSYKSQRYTHFVRCSRCNCTEIKFKLKSVYDRLQGRYAVCGNRKVKSRWDLPGFIYRPNEEFDTFFYGNPKRVLNTGQVKVLKENGDNNS